MIKTSLSLEKSYSDKFALDCLRFLKGNHDVDIDQYAYSDQSTLLDEKSGAQIWEDYLKVAKNYYPFYAEVEILKSYMPELLNSIGESNHLVELGPGPKYSVEQKTSKFFESSNTFKTYTAVDMSKDYLDQSKDYLGSNYRDLNVSSVKGDFFSDFILLRKTFLGKKSPVILMLGNTIANIPERDADDFPNNLLKVMKRLKNIFPSDATFIFGHDINQSEKSILNSYNHPLFVKHELSIFKTIKNDLGIETLDTSAFNLKFDWDPKRYCLDVYANSIRPQKVKILGQNILVHGDSKLHITKSYKYPASLMTSIGRQAGFEPLTHFKDSSDRMAIHIWKC